MLPVLSRFSNAANLNSGCRASLFTLIGTGRTLSEPANEHIGAASVSVFGAAQADAVRDFCEQGKY